MKKSNKNLFNNLSLKYLTSFAFIAFFGLNLTNNYTIQNVLMNKIYQNSSSLLTTHTHTHDNINSNLEYNSNNNFNISSIPSSSEMELDNKWVESIKETQSNKTIKLIFTRNASLVYQQSNLVINYLLQSNNKNNKEMKNEIALFIDNDVHESHDKFNYTYYEELSENYDESQFLLISNQNHFPNITINEPYRIYPTNKMLRTILNFYKNKYGEEVLFDIWIPDLSLASIWGKYISSQEWYEILQHTNHIYLTSDGNAQTFKFVQSYLSWLNKQNKDLESLNNETLLKLDKIFDRNNNLSFDTYCKSVMWEFLRTNLFTIFHISRYVDSPYYQTSLNKMYPAYSFNYDYFDLSNKLFKETEIDKRNNFIKSYELFFNVENAKLNDFVYKGFENYDPNKKNIIWMGDSLIREESHVNEKRTQEIQNTFLGITKKFPVEEYNYFFKHHPYYTTRQQEEMTNFITSKSSSLKPIYFDNFPWELFLSWDKKEGISNIKNYVSFFSINSNDDHIPRTQLVGIQYTSTTILSTYLFLKQNYNLTEDQAYKSINYSNFPVPGTFDIITRGKPSINLYEKQIQINKEKTKDVYEPFLKIGYIKNFYVDQSTTKEFSKINNIESNFFIDDWYNYLLKNPITISIIIMVIIVIVFVSWILTTNLKKIRKI